MSTTRRTPALALCLGAAGALLAGCGGSTVEGQPDTSSSAPPAASPTTASATSPSPAGPEERPSEVSSPVAPPPSPQPAPPGQPAPQAPPPPPGAGDFPALLAQTGVTLPQDKDPVALAVESCTRLDTGQTMVDVTGWLGGETGLDPEKQGYFLGMAVATYCPQNTGRLG